MADFANQTITIAGRRMLATAVAEKRTIQFRTVAIGDGQAPQDPENLTGIVNQLFELGVGQVYKVPDEAGTWCVSCSLVATSDKGNFYCREAGIYATYEDVEDTAENRVLFAYLNAGDTADYIRAVSAKSKTQIDLNFCLVVGAADVLYVYDPEKPLTLKALAELQATVENAMSDLTADTNQKVQKLEQDVNEAIKSFTSDSIKQIQEAQKELMNNMNEAAENLKKAQEGFVLAAGDTMTGKLTINAGGLGVTAGGITVTAGGLTLNSGNLAVNNGSITVPKGSVTATRFTGPLTGDVTGSAERWANWQRFDNLSAFSGLSATTSTVLQIANALPNYSTLTLIITAQNANLPEKIGILEIRKADTTIVNCLFTSFTGNAYVGVVYGGKFIGWTSQTPLPAGVIVAYGTDAAAPLGWLLCNGATYKRTAYPALFAAIGTKWGTSVAADSFKVPDTRGQFLRGWDDGRNLDKSRKFATDQQSAAPNIKGDLLEYNGDFNHIDCASGAFSIKSTSNWVTEGGGKRTTTKKLSMSATKSSSVYTDGITEVRPTNIAVQYIIKY